MIDEEEDDYGDDTFETCSFQSNRSSHMQVSSNGVNEVGDLTDFDDLDGPAVTSRTMDLKIANLYEELACMNASNTNLQKDLDDKQVNHTLDIEKTMDQFREMQHMASKYEDQAHKMKNEGVEAAMARSERLEGIQTLIVNVKEASLDDKVAQDNALQERGGTIDDERTLAGHLQQAVELRRAEADRLYNAKVEVTELELMHAQVVQQLAAQLHALETSKDCATSHMSRMPLHTTGMDAYGQVQSAEQECNVLRNELEWKIVHWESKLENQHQDNAVSHAKIKQVQEELVRQRESNKQLEESIVKADERLRTVSEARRRHQLPPPAAAPRAFPCPSRFFASKEAPAKRRRGGVSCQHVCWQILSAAPDIVALHCSAASLEIIDATKDAYMAWGSRMLHGTSLLDLLSENQMRHRLEKQLEPLRQTSTRQRIVHAAALVRYKTGAVVDSSLTCVSLPAEPHNTNMAAVFVIVDTLPQTALSETSLESASDSMNKPRKRTSYRTQQSSSLSQCSDEIAPSDSISQVLAKSQS
jgi:hypothetical protein